LISNLCQVLQLNSILIMYQLKEISRYSIQRKILSSWILRKEWNRTANQNPLLQELFLKKVTKMTSLIRNRIIVNPLKKKISKLFKTNQRKTWKQISKEKTYQNQSCKIRIILTNHWRKSKGLPRFKLWQDNRTNNNNNNNNSQET